MPDYFRQEFSSFLNESFLHERKRSKEKHDNEIAREWPVNI